MTGGPRAADLLQRLHFVGLVGAVCARQSPQEALGACASDVVGKGWQAGGGQGSGHLGWIGGGGVIQACGDIYLSVGVVHEQQQVLMGKTSFSKSDPDTVPQNT